MDTFGLHEIKLIKWKKKETTLMNNGKINGNDLVDLHVEGLQGCDGRVVLHYTPATT